MKVPGRLVVFALVLGLGGWGALPALGQGGPDGAKAHAATDEDRVVEELCGKRVALLGESPTHGFGKSMQFKAGLVRRLVEECHFNAFFIESGVYDFLKIQERLANGNAVNEAMIAAGIGGVWANKEVQPLVPFLLERVKAGSLTVGGLDDQIGFGSYAGEAMAADLLGTLGGEDRERCGGSLERLLTKDGGGYGYSAADKERILGCLSSVESALGGTPQTALQEDRKAMVASLRRLLTRDFRQEDLKNPDAVIRYTNDRDRSMYLNFEWLLGRLPARSKVIVWAATVHVAKSLSGVSGDETRVPLGSFVRKEFGEAAFALGFSAYSGGYAMGSQPVRTLAFAPPDSFEGRAFAGNDLQTVYLSLGELRGMGEMAGRALGTGFKSARWAEVVDGMLVFREERAPVR